MNDRRRNEEVARPADAPAPRPLSDRPSEAYDSKRKTEERTYGYCNGE
jgi:hypothetical protein